VCEIEFWYKGGQEQEIGIKGSAGVMSRRSGRTFFRIDDEWLGRSFSHQLCLKFFSTTFGERLRISGILPNASQGEFVTANCNEDGCNYDKGRNGDLVFLIM
jgi:hypothetical protein